MVVIIDYKSKPRLASCLALALLLDVERARRLTNMFCVVVRCSLQQALKETQADFFSDSAASLVTFYTICRPENGGDFRHLAFDFLSRDTLQDSELVRPHC